MDKNNCHSSKELPFPNHRRLCLVIAKVTYPYSFGGIRIPRKKPLQIELAQASKWSHTPATTSSNHHFLSINSSNFQGVNDWLFVVFKFGLAIMAFLRGTFGELFGDVNVPLNQEKKDPPKIANEKFG